MKIFTSIKKVLVIFLIFLSFDVILFYLLPINIKADLVVPRAHRIKSYFYHHDLRPSSSFRDHWGYEQNLIFTNNLGFKDQKNRNIKFKEKNILFIGDSFTEGVGLKYNETFVGIIDKKLKKENSNIEILNAGVQSYSPKIYYSKLYDILERKNYPIQHIVIIVSGGDIFDDYFRYNEVNEDNVLVHDDFQNKTILNVINFLKGNTFIYQFISRITPLKVIPDVVKNIFEKDNKKKRYLKKVNNLKDEDIYYFKFMKLKDYDYLYQDIAFNSWGKEAINNSFFYLEKISKLTNKKDIKLDILYAKDAIIILKQPIEKNLDYFINTFKKLENYSNTNFYYLSEYDKDYTKSTDAYKNLFFIEDHHWNKLGNKKIADEILRKIEF